LVTAAGLVEIAAVEGALEVRADRSPGTPPAAARHRELHDIGYAPHLAVTGLHALDGARYLRDTQHTHTMLCRLVAHHSCDIIEAGERGLADVLGLEFAPALTPRRSGCPAC
jgi:hypothetical protein